MLIFGLFLLWSNAFVVDVATSVSYQIRLPRATLREFVDDIGLFRRHMPGVVGVDSLGNERYLYRTQKSVPLAGTLEADFLIERRREADTLTVYESPSSDPNYMLCAVHIRPDSDSTTAITIRLRLRLVRSSGFEIHWMAPLLGRGFIEDRMREDMEQMLEEFIQASNAELYRRFSSYRSLP
jgi:hypothetical protein